MGKKSLFVALILALLLAACGRKKASPVALPNSTLGTGDEQTIISFAVYDWEQASYENLIKAFEEANPDIRVQMVSIDEVSWIDSIGSERPGKVWQYLFSRADVVNLNANPQAVQLGLVRDLTPFMQAGVNFERDDFYPGVLESSQWSGGAWFLPTRLSFVMIVYDKIVFDQAGISYPEPGWSWDDFLTKARALTVREGEQVSRWGFVQVFLKDHWPFIEGRAGPLIDRTTDSLAWRLNQPEVIAALQWYADLYLKEQVVPYLGPKENEVGQLRAEIAALIEKGHAAMWNQSFHHWPWRKEQTNRGIVPYPVDTPDAKTTPIQVQGLSMSVGTQHPNAAWRWMDYVSRQALAADGTSGSFLPARRSVTEASGFWEEIDQELVIALRYALEHSYVPYRPEGDGPVVEALESILTGEKSVQDAVDEITAKTETDIQRTGEQAEATLAPTFVVTAPDKDENVAVTIVFTPGMCGYTCLRPYRDLARQFHELHPEILVEINMPNFTGTYTRIQAIAEKTDCFQWDPIIYSPEQRAVVLSLDPLLEADPAFSIDDFYPQLVDPFVYQGQMWGLPSQFSPVVIEYDKDLFDTAGVDYPPLNWTTDDFLELAVALTHGEGKDKQYGFVPDVLDSVVLQIMIPRLGARLVDESVDPPALSFNDPATVKAVQWYANLSAEFEVKPIFFTDSADMAELASFAMEWGRLVNGGHAAMWINFSGAGNKPEGANIGMTTLPAGIDNTGNAGTVEGLFVSSPAARGDSSTLEIQQACWQWITFLTEQPNLVQGLPARRSVAESAAFRQRVGARRAVVYEASLADEESFSDGQFLRGGSWLSNGLGWLGRAYGQIVRGESTAQEALNEAQKLADDYRACVITKDAFDDLDERVMCLKKVDPTFSDQ